MRSPVLLLLCTLFIWMNVVFNSGCGVSRMVTESDIRGEGELMVEGNAPMAQSKMAEDTFANSGGASSTMASSTRPGHPMAPSLQPQIIKTAQIRIRVKDLPESMKQLEDITRQHQGLITHQTLTLQDAGYTSHHGRLEVRIPQALLESFIEELAPIGTLLSQEITGEDVGAEIVDTEARIRNLKAEESALQAIMQRAGKIPDVLEVSRELSRVRGQIEQSQSRLNYLKQQVAYSTARINLEEETVNSPTEAKPGFFYTISRTFSQALGALYDAGVGLIKLAIWIVVYLLPIGLIFALVGYGIWRCCGKRVCAWGCETINRAVQRLFRRQS